MIYITQILGWWRWWRWSWRRRRGGGGGGGRSTGEEQRITKVCENPELWYLCLKTVWNVVHVSTHVYWPPLVL